MITTAGTCSSEAWCIGIRAVTGARAAALVAIAMGAVTRSIGGIVRDTLEQMPPPVLLPQEIYVTVSVFDACTYVGLNGLNLAPLAAMTAGFLARSACAARRSSIDGRYRSSSNRHASARKHERPNVTAKERSLS